MGGRVLLGLRMVAGGGEDVAGGIGHHRADRDFSGGGSTSGLGEGVVHGRHWESCICAAPKAGGGASSAGQVVHGVFGILP